MTGCCCPQAKAETSRTKKAPMRATTHRGQFHGVPIRRRRRYRPYRPDVSMIVYSHIKSKGESHPLWGHILWGLLSGASTVSSRTISGRTISSRTISGRTSGSPGSPGTGLGPSALLSPPRTIDGRRMPTGQTLRSSGHKSWPRGGEARRQSACEGDARHPPKPP